MRSRIGRSRIGAMVVLTCGALTGGAASSARAAPAPDCAAEAALLEREQGDLPKLEFASPKDRPPYCITLETNMAFALRVKAHAARCPQSDFAGKLAEWDKLRADYGKLFSQNRCKRTF
jgi:hypothetical protein